TRATEPEAVEAHGRAVQGQYPRDLEGQHAAGVPVPPRGGQGAAQRRGEVHGDADDLEGPLAGRGRRGGAVVAVHEPVVGAPGAVAADGDGARGHRALGDHVFVQARAVEGGDAVRSAGAGAVVRRIGGVDVGVLHLDDEEEVAGGDGGGGAGGVDGPTEI